MISSRKISQSGFTVIELLAAATVLIAASILVFVQISNLTVAHQDEQRKTAINAMYYALEEVYYKQNGGYPATLAVTTLPSVDAQLFTDPDGFTLGKEALSESELQKLMENGDTDEDVEKRLAAVTAGKSPNYHYDATECDMNGKCKSYTLRADMAKEAEYIKKNRSH